MRSRKRRLLLLVPVIAAVFITVFANRHTGRVRTAATPDESHKVSATVPDTGEFIPERINVPVMPGELEAENPFSSLKSRFTWKQTIFHKAAVSGYIRNAAAHTKFSHVQARLEVLDERNAIVSTEDISLDDELLPGDSVKVKLKSDERFRRLRDVRLVVISAIPQRI